MNSNNCCVETLSGPTASQTHIKRLVFPSLKTRHKQKWDEIAFVGCIDLASTSHRGIFYSYYHDNFVNDRFNCKLCLPATPLSDSDIHILMIGNTIRWSLKTWLSGFSVVQIFTILTLAHRHHPRLCKNKMKETHFSKHHDHCYLILTIILYRIPAIIRINMMFVGSK